MTANLQERIMALGLCSVALYLMYLSLDFPMESRVFPLAVLGLMAVLAGALAVRSFAKPQGAEGQAPAKPFFVNRFRFFASFSCVVGYIGLLPFLGYFTTSALFFIAMTRLTGYRNNKTLLLTVCIFLSFVYAVFVLLFERPIPPEFFQTF